MHTPLLTASARIILLTLLASSALAHPGSGVAVDKDGNVYFTDTGRAITKVDSAGALTAFTGSRYHWLAIDETGRFADSAQTFGDWFERVTPRGEKPCVIQCSDFPCAMGSDGNLYYVDTRPGSSNKLIRRTPEGRETVLARDVAVEAIAGIAAGPDGSIYVTVNDGAGAIKKITAAGAVTTVARGFAGKEPLKDPPHDTTARYCRALAVADDGTIYIAATGSRRVLRIETTGKVTTVLESSAPWHPTGVALHNDEVFVLEWREPADPDTEDRSQWLPRIRRVAKDGAVAVLVTVQR